MLLREDRPIENDLKPPGTTPFAPPDGARVSDRVTESIRTLILAGELVPGSRIGQEALAARFNVSRIPIRQALSRLESDGLVVLKPNSGAWVAKLDLAECLEIYKVRERIEPLALCEAVARMRDEEIDALETLVVEMSRIEDTETFLRLDRQFHLASYRPAQMQQLFIIIERFWNTTQHYRRAFTKILGKERGWIIHAEHRLMIDALRRRDSDGAGHLLCEHIRRTRFELARQKDLFPPSEVPARRRRKR